MKLLLFYSKHFVLELLVLLRPFFVMVLYIIVYYVPYFTIRYPFHFLFSVVAYYIVFCSVVWYFLALYRFVSFFSISNFLALSFISWYLPIHLYFNSQCCFSANRVFHRIVSPLPRGHLCPYSTPYLLSQCSIFNHGFFFFSILFSSHPTPCSQFLQRSCFLMSVCRIPLRIPCFTSHPLFHLTSLASPCISCFTSHPLFQLASLISARIPCFTSHPLFHLLFSFLYGPHVPCFFLYRLSFFMFSLRR